MRRVMFAATAFLLSAASSTCLACSCHRLSVDEAYRDAEVVFEGIITAIDGPITYGSWPAGAVRFTVVKVWKGTVPVRFEMPAVDQGSNCVGFYSSQLKVGNELLVYANRVAWTPTGEKGFFTHPCARTKIKKDAKEDLARLPLIAPVR